MPVEPQRTKDRSGRTRWRTVEASTGKIATNSETGKPLDGGGWRDTAKGRGKAHRQSEHVNEGLAKGDRKRRSM